MDRETYEQLDRIEEKLDALLDFFVQITEDNNESEETSAEDEQEVVELPEE